MRNVQWPRSAQLIHSHLLGLRLNLVRHGHFAPANHARRNASSAAADQESRHFLDLILKQASQSPAKHNLPPKPVLSTAPSTPEPERVSPDGAPSPPPWLLNDRLAWSKVNWTSIAPRRRRLLQEKDFSVLLDLKTDDLRWALDFLLKHGQYALFYAVVVAANSPQGLPRIPPRPESFNPEAIQLPKKPQARAEAQIRAKREHDKKVDMYHGILKAPSDRATMLLSFLPQAPFIADILVSDLIPNRLFTVRSRPTNDSNSKQRLPSRSIHLLNPLASSVGQLGPPAVKLFDILLPHWRDGSSPLTYANLFENIATSSINARLLKSLLCEGMEDGKLKNLWRDDRIQTHLLRQMRGLVLEHNAHMSTAVSTVKHHSWNMALKFVRPGEFHATLSPLNFIMTLGNEDSIPITGDNLRLRPDDKSLKALGLSVTDATLAALTLGAHVSKVTGQTLQARLRGFIPSYLSRCTWTITHSMPYSVTETAINALATLYSNSLENEKPNPEAGLYSLIDNRQSDWRPPENNAAEQTTFDASDSGLNESQQLAVQTALSQPLSCLWGPPGTGKTHTVLAILVHLLSKTSLKILVTAPTHNAVDNLLERFVQHHRKLMLQAVGTRITPDLEIVSEGALPWAFSPSPDGLTIEKHMISIKRRVKSSRLVFSTCTSAGLALLHGHKFDVVLTDEASQMTESANLIPLAKGAQKAILVGDHVQLAPTVQSPHAAALGHEQSLFARLYNSKSPIPGLGKAMLTTQYRMHDDLATFVSTEFYAGKLGTGVSASERALPESQFPWPRNASGNLAHAVFVPCAAREDYSASDGSKCNEGQTTLTAEIYNQLTATVSPTPLRIVILTPYTSQRESLELALPHATVASIDGFQGREADIVVFVTTRSNNRGEIGFMQDLRRLNVALTRAKRGLIVVGDERTLTKPRPGAKDEKAKGVWRRLIDTFARVEIEDVEQNLDVWKTAG